MTKLENGDTVSFNDSDVTVGFWFEASDFSLSFNVSRPTDSDARDDPGDERDVVFLICFSEVVPNLP